MLLTYPWTSGLCAPFELKTSAEGLFLDSIAADTLMFSSVALSLKLLLMNRVWCVSTISRGGGGAAGSTSPGGGVGFPGCLGIVDLAEEGGWAAGSTSWGVGTAGAVSCFGGVKFVRRSVGADSAEEGGGGGAAGSISSGVGAAGTSSGIGAAGTDDDAGVRC